ncbi:hypothetical protein A5784_08020 [Mycobacterium sp. 852013-50091_SCH5140682]|uniref:polyamine ABC transporter substrate-binding protein n=1 Tax=Mycobacterium sp. 852013-50091_SCH5140682 TaxID=1834109 RepID=UPI0007EBEE31|nr:spermidine/putrescine ABC transporter substrate-binding protein [Mycobacterium sp. 852013-50091_SCH5140682]OBC07732.1 hypothetical protein A5784_08020 [Mycobacterium sp. 852013-50091_SCH5140682]
MLSITVAAVLTLTACGSGPEAEGVEVPNYPTEVKSGSTLRIYSWAEYFSPKNIESFEKATGVKIQIDAYASAEEALAKLRLSRGTSGYDLVVMDGAYVPQLVAAHALLPWDKQRLPGLSGITPTFLNQSWDPGNRYAIPKSGGSTGYVWDSSLIAQPLQSWNDFFVHMADSAVRGRTSVIDGAPSVIGSYFWANGIDDQTTDPANYAAAENYLGHNVIPHLKQFNSYPRAELSNGAIVLAQTFTGDARSALMDGPSTLRFALGSPKTDLYVDHFIMPRGSSNPAAAHAFVQYLLDPGRAAEETLQTGYYTGVQASRAQMPADTPFPEIVFFDDGVSPDRFIPAQFTEDARKQSTAAFQRLKARASQ